MKINSSDFGTDVGFRERESWLQRSGFLQGEIDFVSKKNYYFQIEIVI